MVHRHAELALPDVYFDRDQSGQYTLLSVVRARAGVGYRGRRVGNRRRAVYGAAAVGSALAALLPPFRPLRRSARQPEAPADDGFLPDQRRYFPANGLHRDRLHVLHGRFVGHGRHAAGRQYAADAAFHAVFLSDGRIRLCRRGTGGKVCRSAQRADAAPVRPGFARMGSGGCRALCRPVCGGMAERALALYRQPGDSDRCRRLRGVADRGSFGGFCAFFDRRCVDRRHAHGRDAQFGLSVSPLITD